MINVRLEVKSAGQLDSLAFQPSDRRRPGEGELEIEVTAAGLNFKDVLIGLGVLGSSADLPPLGGEFAGRVVGIGAGVSGFRLNDPVMGIGTGCLSRFVVVKADGVALVPATFTMAEAAAIPGAYLTADFALGRAQLRKGESILIHCASGGVGLAAVMIAKAAGADIYATAGSDEKREYLRSLGVRLVMDSRSFAFADEVREATGGRGVDVVLNSLAGEYVERSMALLAPHGRFVELGVRDILENRALALGPFLKGASLIALGSISRFPDAGQRLRNLVASIERGELGKLPHRMFGSAEVVPAFQHLARARHIGKVVIEMRSGKGRELRAVSGAQANYILPAEGVEVFRRALFSGRRQLAISTIALAPRLKPPVPSQEQAVASKPVGAPAHSHARPKLTTTLVSPRNEVESTLARIWQEFLGIDTVGVEDNFFDLGGDSLLAVQLLTQIRKTLGVNLPPHILVEAPTIAQLAARLPSAHSASPTTSTVPGCMVRLQQGKDGVRPLFLVHPVGGQVYLYRDLSSRLGPEMPVWGIRADADSDSRDLTMLAAQYLSAIRQLQPKGPYRLGGSSFGGTVAYEIAQQLLAQGEVTELLALVDSPTPGDTPDGDQNMDRVLCYLLGLRDVSPETTALLAAMGPEEKLRHFASQGGEAGRRASALSAQELTDLLRLWNANIAALRNYQVRPYPGHVLFFRALREDGMNRTDYHAAWKNVATDLQLHELDGTHISINLPPLVDAIAAAIQGRLDACAIRQGH